MLEELNQRFAHPDVRFSQKDQLIMIELSNRHGSATLTTHGGTLLSYQPANGEEVIWLSETAIYDGSKPVRGGVPICWPWFGPYDPDILGADPTDAAKKGHGVARYELWEVAGVRSVDNEATELVLQLEPNDSIRQAWPLPFMLKLIVTLRAPWSGTRAPKGRKVSPTCPTINTPIWSASRPPLPWTTPIPSRPGNRIR